MAERSTEERLNDVLGALEVLRMAIVNGEADEDELVETIDNMFADANNIHRLPGSVAAERQMSLKLPSKDPRDALIAKLEDENEKLKANDAALADWKFEAVHAKNQALYEAGQLRKHLDKVGPELDHLREECAELRDHLKAICHAARVLRVNKVDWVGTMAYALRSMPKEYQ